MSSMPNHESPSIRRARAIPGHPSTTDTDRDFGVAISRAFDVLRCYTPAQPLLGISELSRKTGLPKATVARLTYTLASLGYLYRVPPSSKYRLGWGLLSLGYPLLTSMPLRQVARPAMHALALHIRANVNLGTLDRMNVVYVESVRFDETSAARPEIGASHPMLQSSIGRAIIASMDTARREPLLNQLRLMDKRAFLTARPEIDKTRRDLLGKGYCTSDSAIYPGYVTIATAMRVPAHEEPLAFNCAMPTTQFRKSEIERDIGPRLVGMVRQIESRLGYA